VRYICLLAILLALPETSPAQVNIVAGRKPRSTSKLSRDDPTDESDGRSV
jgi:hypothetical protein